jgi:hypothetical protein
MYPRKDPKSGLYGYWANGTWAIDPQFSYANPFYNGFAAVETKDKQHILIEANGTRYALRDICGGRTPVKYGFFGFTDSHDYAIVHSGSEKKNEWGLIDRHLRYTALPAAVFSEVTSTDCYGEHIVLRRATKRIDKSYCGLFCLGDMELKIPLKYAFIYGSDESTWVVSRHTPGLSSTSKKHAFLNIDSYDISSDWYWNALPFSHGFGTVNEDGRSPWYYVDRNLQPAFDTTFGGADRFSHGLASVSQGDDAGYIDTTGKWSLLLPHYERRRPFNRFGWAIANRNELEWDLDIIDRRGQPGVRNLDTAVFWDGDFPYFEVSRKKQEFLVDMEMKTIYSQELEYTPSWCK